MNMAGMSDGGLTSPHQHTNEDLPYTVLSLRLEYVNYSINTMPTFVATVFPSPPVNLNKTKPLCFNIQENSIT
jgi:hypothetical protein